MASKRKAQDVSSLRPASVPTGHQSKGRSAAARIADNDDDDNDDDPETAPNRPVKRTRKASTMAKQAGWNQAGELGRYGCASLRECSIRLSCHRIAHAARLTQPRVPQSYHDRTTPDGAEYQIQRVRSGIPGGGPGRAGKVGPGAREA